MLLRREGDSNPRYVFAYMRFPGAPLKPLEHVTILDQDTRLELALTAWKAVVLATNTNPGWLPGATNHFAHHPN